MVHLSPLRIVHLRKYPSRAYIRACYPCNDAHVHLSIVFVLCVFSIVRCSIFFGSISMKIQGRSFVAETSWAPHHARALKTQKQITQMVKQPCGDDCFRSRTNMVCDDSAWLHRLILLTSTTKIGRSEPSKYRAIPYQRYSHFGTRWYTL